MQHFCPSASNLLLLGHADMLSRCHQAALQGFSLGFGPEVQLLIEDAPTGEGLFLMVSGDRILPLCEARNGKTKQASVSTESTLVELQDLGHANVAFCFLYAYARAQEVRNACVPTAPWPDVAQTRHVDVTLRLGRSEKEGLVRHQSGHGLRLTAFNICLAFTMNTSRRSE